VFDESARKDGTFSRDDFTYDHASDVYVCPGGKVLTTTGTLVNDGATMLYVASKRDCDQCALKYRCVPSRHRGKYRARSMRALAIWRARLPGRGKVALRVGSAKRSRCCSRTSNAFSSSTVYGYEAQTARVTSSSSQPHSPGDTPLQMSQLLIAVLELKNDFFPRDYPVPVMTLNLYPYHPRRRGGRPRNSLLELRWGRAKAGAASASRRGEHGKTRGKERQI